MASIFTYLCVHLIVWTFCLQTIKVKAKLIPLFGSRWPRYAFAVLIHSHRRSHRALLTRLRSNTHGSASKPFISSVFSSRNWRKYYYQLTFLSPHWETTITPVVKKQKPHTIFAAWHGCERFVRLYYGRKNNDNYKNLMFSRCTLERAFLI